MRMSRLLLLPLCLLLLLCGCSRPAAEGGPSPSLATNPTDTIPGNTTAPVETGTVWTGPGGSYAWQAYEASGDYYDAFTDGSHMYRLVLGSSADGMTYQLVEGRDNLLYTAQDASISCGTATATHLWLACARRTGNTRIQFVTQLETDGTPIATYPLDGLADDTIRSIRCDGNGNVYLLQTNTVHVLSPQGEPLGDFETEESISGFARAGDGAVFIKVDTQLLELDPASGSFGRRLDTGEYRAHDGDATYLFYYSDAEGLYGFNPDAQAPTPILLWGLCRISLGTLQRLTPMTDSRFLTLSSAGLGVLTPVPPEEIDQRTEITVATLSWFSMDIDAVIAQFNNSNPTYFARRIDYTQSNALSYEEAMARLTVDILTGQAPDVLCMDAPALAAKGYLLDLYPLLDTDTSLSRSDFVLLDALERDGRLYCLSPGFAVETLLGLRSTFGDRNGWTLAEYLEMEAALPAGSEMIYCATRQDFLRNLCIRYIPQAVDWATAQCDFENETFYQILNTAMQIRENPESNANLNTTPSPQRLAEGSLIAAPCYINSVTSLAQFQRQTGQPVCSIGYPSADGRGASLLQLSRPLSISSQSTCTDGAWAFVRYYVTEAAVDLPLYRPLLDAQMEAAMSDEQIALTQEEAKQLRTLLDTATPADAGSETILQIIAEEASALFDGVRSAEETAALIQQRVEIYLAEQS